MSLGVLFCPTDTTARRFCNRSQATGFGPFVAMRRRTSVLRVQGYRPCSTARVAMSPGALRPLVCRSFVALAIVCTSKHALAQEHSRLFGVLPNYTTVEDRGIGGSVDVDAPAISRSHSFKVATQ